jgi:magnesium-dependent phosphatase 1
LWIDTHVDGEYVPPTTLRWWGGLWIGAERGPFAGPLHRKAQRVNEVLDRNDHPISFYRDVADIFHKIRAHRFADEGDAEDKVVIAACSRTHAPDL